MFNNILVVCVGNICRSPYAEQVLKREFPDKHISSAGIAVAKSGLNNALWYKTGAPIAQRRGIETETHRATQLTSAMCREADLILVMEKKHIAQVVKIDPAARGKVIPIGQWINREIPDPYGQSPEAFEFCYNLIDEAVASLQAKI